MGLSSFESNTIHFSILNSLMSWYNTYSDSTQRLDALLDTNPTLPQLLNFPEFIELLKAYQPKLLEYITNSQIIPSQIVEYLTMTPKDEDSQDRKHKLPLMTVMMVETNTTCIINSFFKSKQESQRPYLIEMYYQLLEQQEEPLPLLCGYFGQINVTLWNSRYKEAIDLMYQHPEALQLLLKHTHSKALINTLLLYLNLDQTRHANPNPQRTQLKLSIINQLYQQIKQAGQEANEEAQVVVENISQVLIEIIEKYYLIADGKAMLDIIVAQPQVKIVVEMLMRGDGLSMAISGVVGWLMRYYCLSSFNTEDFQNAQLNKKNQQRLEAQPFTQSVIEVLPKVIDLVSKAQSPTLYHSRLLEIFNMALELSSPRLAHTFIKGQYIQALLQLLFKFPELSIIHKLVQKVFLQMFSSDRTIYQLYKHHLFVQAGLMQLTIGSLLSNTKDLENFKDGITKSHEGGFGCLMRIIKIYSKIQTSDEEINASIVKRSQMWQTFSNHILKPYEAMSIKDLGTYDIKDSNLVDYSVKYCGGQPKQQVSSKVFEEISQEQSMQFKQTRPEPSVQPQATLQPESALLPQKDKENANDALFAPQEFTDPSPNQLQREHVTSGGSGNDVGHNSPQIKKEETKAPQNMTEEEQIAANYKKYISEMKVEVDKQIKNVRSSSREKRLSANKSRVTSPSPKKKRWDAPKKPEPQPAPAPRAPEPAVKPPVPLNKVDSQGKRQKISLTQMGRPPTNTNKTAPSTQPTIAPQENSVISEADTSGEVEVMGKSAVTESKEKDLVASTLQPMSKSAVFLRQLKKVQFKKEPVKRLEKRQHRKVGEQDKALLEFLGIKT